MNESTRTTNSCAFNGVAALAFGFLMAASNAGAATLISDDFTGFAADTSISDRLPPVSTGGWKWQGPAADSTIKAFYGNGLDSASAKVGNNRTALIDLGAGYFAANKGVYTLTATVSFGTVTGTGTLRSWFGVGFSTAETVSGTNNLVDNGGHGWMNLRLNGETSVYRGAGTANAASQTGVTILNSNELKLELDTSGATWYLRAWLNGVEFDLDTATAGTAYAYSGSNIPNLRSIAISTGANNGSSDGTVDNFSLTFAPVPEPSSLVLAAVSGLFVFRRRR